MPAVRSWPMRPHRGDDAGHAVVGIGDPALGVPDLHAAVLALAVHPLGLQRGVVGQRLIVDADEIEPGKEGVGAVAEQLVARVRGGAGAADEHLHAGLLAGLDDCLGHGRVDLAEARNVGAPAGNGDALPGLVPQFHGVDRPLRPAVARGDQPGPRAELRVVLRQPGAVVLGVQHPAVIVQPGARAAQRHRRGAVVDGKHRSHVVASGPLNELAVFRRLRLKVGRGGRREARAEPRALDAELLEEREDVLVHQVGPGAIEGVGGELHAARVGLDDAHQAGDELPALSLQIHDQRVAAEEFRNPRPHCQFLCALRGQIHAQRGIAPAGAQRQAHDVGAPHVARLRLRRPMDHLHPAARDDGRAAPVDEPEQRLRLLAAGERVDRRRVRSREAPTRPPRSSSRRERHRCPGPGRIRSCRCR